MTKQNTVLVNIRDHAVVWDRFVRECYDKVGRDDFTADLFWDMAADEGISPAETSHFYVVFDSQASLTKFFLMYG